MEGNRETNSRGIFLMTCAESCAHGLSAVLLTPSKQIVLKRVLLVSERKIFL